MSTGSTGRGRKAKSRAKALAKPGAAATGGGIVGAIVSNTDLFQRVLDAYIKVLGGDQGFATAIASVLVFAAIWFAAYAFRRLEERHDAEIDRISEDKKWYQEQLAGRLPSSGKKGSRT